MTRRNKELADENIRSLREDRSTNLWQGIKAGLDVFKDHINSGRAPAIMVLTDGQPNIG
jgi:Mg-chelatase subunit ChlD